MRNEFRTQLGEIESVAVVCYCGSAVVEDLPNFFGERLIRLISEIWPGENLDLTAPKFLVRKRQEFPAADWLDDRLIELSPRVAHRRRGLDIAEYHSTTPRSFGITAPVCCRCATSQTESRRRPRRGEGCLILYQCVRR